MTRKFERVLSDEEIVQVIAGLSIDPLFSYRHVANAIQDAMLAKLAEQVPVAWVHPTDPTRSVTHHQKLGAIKDGGAIEKTMRVFSVPVYAHPMPCVSPTSDKAACVSESRENDRQLARNQPCGCVICYCENEERCLGCGAKYCGTHDIGETPNPVYVDHIPDASKMVFDPDAALTLAERTLSVEITEQLADELIQFARKLHEKYTQADHIPDGGKMIAPEGYALVPVEITAEMLRDAHIRSELGAYAVSNLSEGYSLIRNLYDVLVAAAPKIGESK